MLPEYHLSERHQNILSATVRHYVATAEPVGSKTLAEEYGFRVSSATIRNAMGSLEKVGLLYQPHTSAGRIPSDSGYRIYVDQLMRPNESWGRQLENLYTKQLDWRNCSFESLLQGAAQILATLSGYIALITLPQVPNDTLRHLQLIRIDANQVMLIVVTDPHRTQSILIDFPLRLEAEGDRESLEGELQILSNFLNHKLRGRSLSTLASLDWGELDREFQHYANFLRDLLQELSRRSQVPSASPIVIRGIAEALRQPEFSQVNQVQMLLQLLEEEQKQLFPSLFSLPDKETDPKRVTVRIGAENSLEPLNTCAVVAASYRQGKIPVGSVGIIGPTRMFYENAIALVETAADLLSDALS